MDNPTDSFPATSLVTALGYVSIYDRLWYSAAGALGLQPCNLREGQWSSHKRPSTISDFPQHGTD